MNKMPGSQRGALMIEVLIAIAIVIFGVMSVMRVQARLQLSEAETYQRTQALILLDDMVSRIETNRNDAENYLTDTDPGKGPLGTGATWCTTPETPTLQQSDSAEWCSALQGAGEVQGGSSVGAMIGARGCVERNPNAGPLVREYMVTVVWQGMTPISAPPPSVTCGATAFDDPDTDCEKDRCRRYVSTIVRHADLEDI